MAPQTPLVKNLPEKAGDARGKGRSLGCVDACRGPALVDPGNSKRGQSWHLGKDYLIRNIKRLGKNSVVGKLVEKRG